MSEQAGPRPLSQVRVWGDLRSYYSDNGVQAWSDTVPYHVTSNPLIADSYANVIVRFIADVVATGRFDPEQPFYLLELGAGSGKFGFHLLRRLTELRRGLGLGGVDVVHVMTDVAPANIEHWRRNPRLRPFLDAGLLRFALLDVEVDTDVHLVTDAKSAPGPEIANFANPPVVIANYLFDSVAQDFFIVTAGRLEQMLAEVATADRGAVDDAVLSRLAWTAAAADIPYYHDPDIDGVLAERMAVSSDQAFLFPIASLRFLKRLLGRTGGRMCLVASDLGVSDRGLRNDLELELTSGYFYLPVDLDTVGSFALRFGPGIHANAQSSALDTCLSVVGFEADELFETRHAFSVFVESFGVAGHKTVARLLERAGATMSVEDWLSIAALLRYDSRFLDASVDMASTWTRSGPLGPRARRQMFSALERIGSNCYWIPGAPDTYFNIGLILHELGEAEHAVAAFSTSLAMVGPAPETFFNLGLCLQEMGRSAEAKASFAHAVELNPAHVRARGWAAQIEYDQSVASDSASAAAPGG